MKKWYRLDNAAQIFPAVASADNASVFRLALVLQEAVKPTLLQQAVDQLQARFPTLTVRLRAGLFWHYFDQGDEQLPVTAETEPPCTVIDPATNHGYLLKVRYFGQRLSVEVFHSLTDGTGASTYVTTLLAAYLRLTGELTAWPAMLKAPSEAVAPAEVVDSFADYYQADGATPNANNPSPTALLITGTPLTPARQIVISGCVPATTLNQLAKKAGVTITAYLVATLASAIYETRMRYRNRSEAIVITVPVNLRRHFPSQTLRNFFSAVPLVLQMSPDLSFAMLLQQVAQQLKQQTSQPELQAIINNYVRLQKNQAARFVPLALKESLMRVGYHLGDKTNTITFSNLGRLQLPTEMSAAVSHGEFLLSPDGPHPLICGAWTVNDQLTISFSRTIVETDVIAAFFRQLRQRDHLPVVVYSSEEAGENENL